MRNLLSILLLAIFALPLASSLLALGPQEDAGLPACCRRNGAHHCSGMVAGTSVASADRQSFSASPQRCPRFPLALAALHPSSFIPSLSASVLTGDAGKPASDVPFALANRAPADTSHPKRGPPTTL